MLLLGGGRRAKKKVVCWGYVFGGNGDPRHLSSPSLASWPPWGEQLPWSNMPTLMCWLPQAPKQQFNWSWIQTSKIVSQDKVFTCKNVLSQAFTIAIGCWLVQKSTIFPVDEDKYLMSTGYVLTFGQGPMCSPFPAPPTEHQPWLLCRASGDDIVQVWLSKL